nr:caffeic acid 3-O-methyltransferase-like [Tanacetum cinerariifolium]
MLDRMLRLLASHSILTCTICNNLQKPVREYGLAPVAKHFLPNEDGVSLVPMLELHQDKLTVDTWFKVEEAVLEGGTPFDKVHGTSGFEYMGLDARFNKNFNKAMVDTSIIVIKEVLNCYHGFDNLKSLVDIGGGLGITLNMIISKHPKIKGINLDPPHVIQHAPQYPGGDMFQNLPQGKAIFMKWVLHGWSDSNCIKLLKNFYKSLPEHGKVIVVDKILPVLPDTSSYVKCGTNLDTIMMTQTPGGKERTEDEFLALAKSAGFGGMRKTCKKKVQQKTLDEYFARNVLEG